LAVSASSGDIVTAGKIKVAFIEFPDTTTQSTAATGGGGGGEVVLLPLTVKNVTGSYTIIPSDLNNTYIRVESPVDVPVTVTIPYASTLPCAIGSRLLLAASDYGFITIKGAAGVAVKSPQSTTIGRKVGRVSVIKTDTDQWEIDGQLDLSTNPTE